MATRVFAAGAVAMLMAACGDDDDSSSTTDPADDVCTDSQALSASVDDLKDVDLVAEGTDGASAAITAVKDDLAAFSESAGAEVQPEVQAVEDAIDELETAVENLDGDPDGTAREAVSNVASSASTLITTLDDGACG
jgi:hypothetical protein